MTKKRITAVFAAFFLCITLFCFVSSAESSKVYIIDDAKVISKENEKRLEDKAKEVASKTGFNIVVIASDNIGSPKTDAHVVEFANDKYEELCGIDTDGILFLINCDTKYDYISTSGSCIEYFSDDRIDSIFDEIWDYLKAENFSQAAYGFLECVEYYHSKGRANHDLSEPTFNFVDTIQVFGSCLFITLSFGTGFYAANKKQFNVEKPTTRNYILNNSLVFDNNSDVFVRRMVNKVYSPRSSSSSGSHRSSGHHSSTHHSHSGGHHGGGGRHR